MDEANRRLSKQSKRSGGSPLIPISCDELKTIEYLLNSPTDLRKVFITNGTTYLYCAFCGKAGDSHNSPVKHLENCSWVLITTIFSRILADGKEALED